MDSTAQETYNQREIGVTIATSLTTGRACVKWSTVGRVWCFKWTKKEEDLDLRRRKILEYTIHRTARYLGSQGHHSRFETASFVRLHPLLTRLCHLFYSKGVS